MNIFEKPHFRASSNKKKVLTNGRKEIYHFKSSRANKRSTHFVYLVQYFRQPLPHQTIRRPQVSFHFSLFSTLVYGLFFSDYDCNLNQIMGALNFRC